MRLSLPHIRATMGALRFAPAVLRGWAMERTFLAPWLRRRLLLEGLAGENGPAVDAARKTQFAQWHPEDLEPRLGGHSLQVLSREFFERHGAEAGWVHLRETMRTLPVGSRLLIYAPHSFAFRPREGMTWIPGWEEIHEAACAAGLRVLDFNPGFDRNGFFYFLAERPTGTAEAMTLTGAGHYFYLQVGASLTIGNSASVLSATGLRALRQVASPVTEHSFYAEVPKDVLVQPGDLAMGHYGRWVTGARRSGARTILYGPGDRFRPERHDAPFFEEIQTQGSFAAQYEAAHMVIMQAGGRWRMTDPFPHPGLCRWMDLPVSPALFPRTKKKIAPPGQRVFCFIGLYDDYQKGLDIARALCRRCPQFQFIALGCKPIDEPNCREYPAVDNRRTAFRRIAAQADFIVSPARDDAQPGTIAECGSLGLLPIISETTGYVLSFPGRLDTEDLDQCATVLRDAQTAASEEVEAWRVLNAQYIEQFHRPDGCDTLMQFYLSEAIAL